MQRKTQRIAALAFWLAAAVPIARADADASSALVTPSRLSHGESAWLRTELGAVRGVTIGPIESALHPDKGYGTAASARMMREARRLGATWVSLTPFGRTWDLAPTGVSLTFEQQHKTSRKNVAEAVEQAHAEGLRVFLAPQLWIETGKWRGEIDPADDDGWRRWADGYRAFVITWAELAAETRVDMFSVGVELRSWVTTTRAPSFIDIIEEVRRIYPGLITYCANWDDVEDTVILGELDLIGVNAFYPLAETAGAPLDELLQGGKRVATRLRQLAEAWDKPVILTEFGYTTRRDPALRPWEWPEHMSNVVVDELAQADAYRALLAPLLGEPAVAGAFVWRYYADPDDMSQEAEWGFSPRGKLAELVLRDAFAAHWASDGERPIGAALHRRAARAIGVY
jgi:hypothetical protein